MFGGFQMIPIYFGYYWTGDFVIPFSGILSPFLWKTGRNDWRIVN